MTNDRDGIMTTVRPVIAGDWTTGGLAVPERNCRYGLKG
jgi:hypothetical protein